MGNSENERIEVKAMVPSSFQEQFYSWVNQSICPIFRLHPNRSVNSIYFDDNDFSAAFDNISGISNRTKMRLRWYGDCVNVPVFLEFKAKHNSLGQKDTMALQSTHCHHLLEKKFATMNRLLFRECNFARRNFVNRSQNHVLSTHYHREYYFCHGTKIRLTFDRSIVCFDQRFNQKFGKKHRIRLPQVNIIEIKCPPSSRNELIKLMEDFPFQTSKFSKYVFGLTHMLA